MKKSNPDSSPSSIKSIIFYIIIIVLSIGVTMLIFNTKSDDDELVYCPACDGTGYYNSVYCPICKGLGKVDRKTKDDYYDLLNKYGLRA